MYEVFARNWWKDNPSYPDGLEPDSWAPKTTYREVETEAEARDLCRELNAKPGFTKAQLRLGRKYEFKKVV